MKKKFSKTGNYLTVLIFLILGYSCVSTQSLLIEIPEPAPKNLPANIQSLTIVTQAVDNNYSDLSSDSLQNIFYEKNFRYDTVVYDFQMADTTMKALGELLFESGRYDYVIPENRFLPPQRSSFFGLPLPWDTIKNLAQTFETDAVLSLDHLKTRVVTDYGSESYFDPFQDGFFSAATAQMQIMYEALFRVYDPAQEKVLMREFLRDTLYWEDTDVSTRNLFTKFTPVKQALTEAGISIALDFSEKISMIWFTEQRNFFIKGNTEMKQATQLANSGDWQTAIALWKEISENAGSKTLRSKAQYNIAVGNEILGDLNAAVSWALKSYNTMYRPITYEYLQILERRKSELKNK
ncbi:hypothetical protein SAMN05444280_106120 [Tangfeifania diversioriginum]|uniref:Uncharacterized protein n=1 Tax=Tangfeifania diversioriginum TaxID=1168035 RepID=A0A1M6E9U6_9BACT|nr:DUF6340 family protein [Tangfeifania diversioriginum]SHI82284.1 hypothetical protein SAMN05444280_106120 [Tangfeifania diversioriginum]